jgi:hypothetical protein
LRVQFALLREAILAWLSARPESRSIGHHGPVADLHREGDQRRDDAGQHHPRLGAEIDLVRLIAETKPLLRES